jgi:hypothetical protein
MMAVNKALPGFLGHLPLPGASSVRLCGTVEYRFGSSIILQVLQFLQSNLQSVGDLESQLHLDKKCPTRSVVHSDCADARYGVIVFAEHVADAEYQFAVAFEAAF